MKKHPRRLDTSKKSSILFLLVLVIGLIVSLVAVRQQQDTRAKASHSMPIISGKVLNTQTNDGIGGIQIFTCYNSVTVVTDSGGNFSFSVPDPDVHDDSAGPDFCVRVVNPPAGYTGPILNPDYSNAPLPGPSSTSISYEFQLAGANCRRNGANCGDKWVNYDRNSDSGFDFGYTPDTPPNNSILEIGVEGPPSATAYSTSYSIGTCAAQSTRFNVPATCRGFRFGAPSSGGGLYLHVDPVVGWKFKNWRVDRAPIGGSINCNTTDPDACYMYFGNDESVKVTAVYEKEIDSTLTINVVGPTTTLTFTGEFHDVGDCLKTFPVAVSKVCRGFEFGWDDHGGTKGGVVVVAPPAPAGWIFEGWTGETATGFECGTSLPSNKKCVSFGSGDKTITATYTTINDSKLTIKVVGPTTIPLIFKSEAHSVGDCNPPTAAGGLPDITVTGTKTCTGFEFGWDDHGGTKGGVVVVAPSAPTGWTFKDWTGDAATGFHCVSLPATKKCVSFGTGEKTITATYTSTSPTVTSSPTPSPTKSPTPSPTKSPTPSITGGPSCPLKSKGDANCNGSVTLADFEIWRREFIGELTTKAADFNGDGKVSLADFEIWRRGFTAP